MTPREFLEQKGISPENEELTILVINISMLCMLLEEYKNAPQNETLYFTLLWNNGKTSLLSGKDFHDALIKSKIAVTQFPNIVHILEGDVRRQYVFMQNGKWQKL